MDITRLAFTGEGIGSENGKTYFVAKTVPGDRIRFEKLVEKKKFGRGKILELLQASPQRIAPRCKYFDTCGGCHLQHIEPSWLKDEKINQLEQTFARLGPGHVKVLPIIEAEAWNYRNRLLYHRNDQAQGYRSVHTREILDIETCEIATLELNEAWSLVREKLRLFSATDIPKVFLRSTHDRTLLSFSITDLSIVPKLQKTFQSISQTYWIYYSIIEQDSYQNHGNEFFPLFDEPKTIFHQIGDIKYLSYPQSFSQVNSKMAEIMMNHLISSIQNLTKQKEAPSILDLYCGSGFFTLPLAKKGYTTLGIELDRWAIESAQATTKTLGLGDRARWRVGKADRLLKKLVAEKEKFSICVLDPPRKGLEKSMFEWFQSLGIQDLFYISCSPPTLARDMVHMKNHGYNLQSVQPFEMFPQTYHIETLTHFQLDKNH
ncbi:MAG: 23S rRNA (uracil(1939)-C(5))-methyltransferase RlmD [Bdellovibrionota bacterium]